LTEFQLEEIHAFLERFLKNVDQQFLGNELKELIETAERLKGVLEDEILKT
jgi:hypothetical protein